MSDQTIASHVGAVLFVATEPLSIASLASAIGANVDETKQALDTLTKSLPPLGLAITHLDDYYRLVSSPAASAVVRKYMIAEAGTELTKAALETLAIVAYRGPLTRSAIEEVRGVSSDAMIRNLLSRGLIRQYGRSQEPGSPITYAVSHGFLQHFGLQSPEQLPAVPEIAGED